MVVQSLGLYKAERQLKHYLPRAVNWEVKPFHQFYVSRKKNQNILSKFSKSVIKLGFKIKFISHFIYPSNTCRFFCFFSFLCLFSYLPLTWLILTLPLRLSSRGGLSALSKGCGLLLPSLYCLQSCTAHVSLLSSEYVCSSPLHSRYLVRTQIPLCALHVAPIRNNKCLLKE